MAVTADQYTKWRGASCLGDGPVAASTTLYDLSLCFVNSGGYIDDDTSTGSNKFAGVVGSGQADNSSGSNGDVDVEYYQEGEFLLTGAGLAITDVGSKVYASDNFTVTTTSTNNTYIGTITKFESATQVWVKIDVQTP